MRSSQSTTKATVYEIITDRIIQQLEKGVVPWRKPWSGAGSEPANLISRKAYRGVNVFMLSCSAYGSPFWLTFKQADMWGGHVRKGEKGTPVVFWKFFEGTESEDAGSDGDAPARRKCAPLLRYYTVFNSEQCDGLPAKLLEVAQTPERPASPIAACDAIVDGMPANRPGIELGFNGAFYRPSTDTVHIPKPERFESDEAYYATLFHELTHATGHQSRLNRKGITGGEIRFGSPSYSQEELCAEMGAAFLCGHAGIDTAPQTEQHAAYVASWLAKLRGDCRLVVTAAAQAQKAADWILRRTWQPAADE